MHYNFFFGGREYFIVVFSFFLCDAEYSNSFDQSPFAEKFLDLNQNTNFINADTGDNGAAIHALHLIYP